MYTPPKELPLKFEQKKTRNRSGVVKSIEATVYRSIARGGAYLPAVIDSGSVILREDRRRNGGRMHAENREVYFVGWYSAFYGRAALLLANLEAGIHVAMFCWRVAARSASKKRVVKLEASQAIAESASSL